ncbi:unnamed protein product [Effrenium voratum]|uniref:RING-type domain-containing protein n=1 Tax=Effrenium voratum TaxID=2562239 RepID=A0AA36N7H1_9DINO|nr:unnamed protein product [Effrenium voratum]CAJ1393261.1 unnamed protein product [Effrenium voratum]CAJ1427920.1 unnamed protein product [Effrenium voratum]
MAERGPGDEASASEQDLLAEEVLFVILSVALLVVCSVVAWQLAQLYRLLLQERSVRQFRPRAGLGLPAADLQSLLAEPAPDASECCVCLQEIEESTPSLRLQCCSHIYHHSCIVEWLRVVASCPMCRQHVGSQSEAADVGP